MELDMGMWALYRKVVDWWNTYPPEGLDFYYQRTIEYSYHSEEVVTRVPSLKWYLRKRYEGYGYKLTIGSVYHEYLIPVIDADTESCMVSASLWLDENNIKHTIMSSSLSGFWILVDKAGRWKDVECMMHVPGQDGHFAAFSCARKMCYIRGVMKEDYHVPVLVKESGSELIDGFANELIKHFSSDAVRWLHRLESYKRGDMDFANPNEVDLSINLEKVLT